MYIIIIVICTLFCLIFIFEVPAIPTPFQAGPDYFQACLELVKTHKLYARAADVFASDARALKEIHNLHAAHLCNEKRFIEATLLYVSSGEIQAAFDACCKVCGCVWEADETIRSVCVCVCMYVCVCVCFDYMYKGNTLLISMCVPFGPSPNLYFPPFAPRHSSGACCFLWGCN